MLLVRLENMPACFVFRIYGIFGSPPLDSRDRRSVITSLNGKNASESHFASKMVLRNRSVLPLVVDLSEAELRQSVEHLHPWLFVRIR